jgi:hypothetical protein
LVFGVTAFYKKEMEAIQDPSLNDELTFLETVRKVEQAFFPEKISADVEKGVNVGGEVEGEKKRKHDEVEQGEAKKDDDDEDDDDDDDEAEAIKRRKMEEADEQLARQLAAQEEALEEEQQSGADDMQRGDEGDGEEANGQCVVCWTEKKSVLFLPCRHLCSCKACGDKTTQCPLCRKAIQQKTDVFV